MQNKAPVIIFLRGTTSAGKSTLANTIAHISDINFLVIGIDHYMDLMPKKYKIDGEQAHQGYPFTQTEKDGRPYTHIGKGPFGEKLSATTPKIVKVLADDQHNIVIDEVVLSAEYMKQYAKALSGHRVYFIGVRCSYEVAEQREKDRGDRPLGLVHWQYEKLDPLWNEYDFVVRTDQMTPEQAAQQILDFVAQTPEPTVFKKLSEHFHS